MSKPHNFKDTSQAADVAPALSRREFLKRTAVGTALGATIGAAVLSQAQNAQAAPAPAANAANAPKLPQRVLGKTGVMVSMLGFGGGSRFLVKGDDAAAADRAIAQLNRAVELGITYFDTADSYGRDRKSERYYGLGLEAHRKNIFLATKTGKRTYDGVMKSVEESLKLLKTDHLDLIQMHDVGPRDTLENWEKPDGGLTALRKLQDQKVVRFVGFTGHQQAEVHKKVLETLTFDTVLMALNASEHKPFGEVALPVAVEKRMGIIGMKAMRGTAGEGKGKATPAELLAWSWEQPVATVIVGMETIEILEQNIELARNWKPGQVNVAALTEQLRPHVTSAQLGWAMPGYRDSFA
ncbi:MAG: uncharacterized protein JWN98_2374 [Abditibacteriota bacterium]|nr:uncharacterized protein [Abditibacteriota bacterium]